jgi:methylthioribulose-1-phosphate dehydratase
MNCGRGPARPADRNVVPEGEAAEDPVRAAGQELAAEAARFAALGWMRGTSGNLSVVLGQAPLRLAVTSSGLDKGELSASDVVVVDEAGRAVALGEQAGGPGEQAGGRRPSAEAALHARIAALTGAGAVVHVHTVASVAAGWRWPGGVELENLEMLKGIEMPAEGTKVIVPVIANSQDMQELGGRFEQARQPGVPAVVIAGHGLYAWGADLLAARHHTEVIEWLLEYALATA